MTLTQNHIITSSHIHLFVQDQGKGDIAQSMPLIAGRTAQEYNTRIQQTQTPQGAICSKRKAMRMVNG